MIAVALAAAFAGVPGARVVTYPIAGRDVAAIRASLDTAGPTDPNDGSRVEAITHWSLRWQRPSRADKGRALAAATVRFHATVTLPRLVDDVPADVAAAWARYRTALAAHEASHVRYAYAHRGEVRAAIRHATCRTAQAAAQAVVARLTAHDLAYDRDTAHGASEDAVFP